MRDAGRAVLLGAILSTLAIAQGASAQDEAAEAEAHAPTAEEEQEARKAFERGRIHYENGDFLRAAEAFEFAYELSGRTDLLYNVYVANRDASRQQRAADALRAYLENTEVVENRPLLVKRLAALEAWLAERAAEEAEAAEQQAADEEAADEAQADEAEAEPAPLAEPVKDRWWLYPTVVMAAGGALMVASVPTGVMSRSKAKDLEDQCSGTSCPPDLKADADSGKTLAIVTDALLFGGAAVAVGGAVWMLLTRPKEKAATAQNRVRPSFGCAPGACAGSLTVDF